jgi:hypothetical protein
LKAFELIWECKIETKKEKRNCNTHLLLLGFEFGLNAPNWK